MPLKRIFCRLLPLIVCVITGCGGGSSDDSVMSTSSPVAPSPDPPARWLRFHANNQNTGQGVGRGATGKLKWVATGGGTSPAIGNDGTVYNSGPDQYVYAVNPTNGIVRWRTQMGERGTAPSIGPDGTVYVGSGNGNLYALDGQTGQIKWRTPTGAGAPLIYSPTIGSESLFIASADGYLYAMDLHTGAIKWKSKGKGTLTAATALGVDGTVFIETLDNDLCAFDQNTGALKWQTETTGSKSMFEALFAAPVVGPDGTVFVGSSASVIRDSIRDVGFIFAIDGATGRHKWRSEIDGSVTFGMALSDAGTLFILTDIYGLYALDSKRGTVLWHNPTQMSIPDVSAPVIGDDGTIYAAAYEGLYAFDPVSGRMKWKYPVGQTEILISSPALASNGTIYVSSAEGYIRAIH